MKVSDIDHSDEVQQFLSRTALQRFKYVNEMEIYLKSVTQLRDPSVYCVIPALRHCYHALSCTLGEADVNVEMLLY